MTSGKRTKANRGVQQVPVNPAGKTSQRGTGYRETYENRMLTEMAAQIVELEEIIQNHLASHGANDAKRPVQDIAFRKERCVPCDEGVPHTRTSLCAPSRSFEQAKAAGELSGI